ncbi:MAG: MarR family transcriptional regulator [Planctomycetales bacterium 12-60-4]|nr:MAG: MarR family transcriptional regulator [Planctomycetales bacterium 12-60-4]
MKAIDEAQTDRLPKFDSLRQQAFLELWKTYDCLKAEEESVFGEFDISSQQYNALRLLKAVAPSSLAIRALGQRMITRAPDMTRLLDRLEDRELIVRVRRDDNRRVVEVSITKAGTKLLQQIAKPIRACHQRQLGHLPDEQLMQLIELLRAARNP